LGKDNVSVPKDRLYAWHASTKSLVMFPGIEAKLGKEIYQDLCNTVLDLEARMGVDKVGETPRAAKPAPPRFTIAK